MSFTQSFFGCLSHLYEWHYSCIVWFLFSSVEVRAEIKTTPTNPSVEVRAGIKTTPTNPSVEVRAESKTTPTNQAAAVVLVLQQVVRPHPLARTSQTGIDKPVQLVYQPPLFHLSDYLRHQKRLINQQKKRCGCMDSTLFCKNLCTIPSNKENLSKEHLVLPLSMFPTS